MTHQAPANRWSLFLYLVSVVLFSGPQVSVVGRFCLCDGRTEVRSTDVRTPCLIIMITYSAVAWWVKKWSYKKKYTFMLEMNLDTIELLFRFIGPQNIFYATIISQCSLLTDKFLLNNFPTIIL